MKTGDLVLHNGTQTVAVYECDSYVKGNGIINWCDGTGRQSVNIGNLRPLTPEEQAAHALGWRGPGQQVSP